MDAFVVLNREEYIKLTGITPEPKSIPKVETYQPTDADKEQLAKVSGVIDGIFKKYGKKKVVRRHTSHRICEFCCSTYKR